MKKIWLGLGVLLLLLAAGCGVSRQAAKSSRSSAPVRSRQASAASTPPRPTRLAQLKAKSKTQLVYAPFGDSLSVGLFADKKATRFTSLFARQLARLTSKTVTEAGIAEVGKTATNLGVPALPQLIAQHPDVITIEFGTNDAVGGATPTALAAYQQALTTIVTTLQKETSAQLILMTMPLLKQWGKPTRYRSLTWQPSGKVMMMSPDRLALSFRISLPMAPGIRSTLINAAMIKLLLNSLKLWRNDTCKHR